MDGERFGHDSLTLFFFFNAEHLFSTNAFPPIGFPLCFILVL